MESSINKFFVEFKKSLDQSLKASHQSLLAVERRSKLLWWKETLYSTTLKDSYRTLHTTIQPVILSYDLYHLLPDFAPVSVDFLLQDTLRALNPNGDTEITFNEYLDQIIKSGKIDIIKDCLPDENVVGRQSFKNFLGAFAQGHVDAKSLEKVTGIDGKATSSMNGVAVMLLHELFADYLAGK